MHSVPLYVIGQLQPVLPVKLEEWQTDSTIKFPVDYSTFLLQYGFGSINELLMIDVPDPDYMTLNFGDHLDIWDLTDLEKREVINGLTVATTIDGDILLLTRNTDSFVLLPRHSDTITRFPDFNSVIEFYVQRYELGTDLYFDPYVGHAQEYISFIINNKLDKDLFDKVHEALLANYRFDRTFNAAIQPKYVLQSIGGWVYADAIGKSAIRVKYQQAFVAEAAVVIEFIKDKISDHTS